MRKIRRTFSVWKTIQSYWKEAFPDEMDSQLKFQQRREDAQKQRELVEKILDGSIVADEHVPEWKRGALVRLNIEVNNDEERDDDDEEEGLISQIRKSILTDKKDHNELDLINSELSEMDFYTEGLKQNLSTKLNILDNPLLEKVKDKLTPYITNIISEPYIELQKLYPDREPEHIEEELKHVFIDMYNNYLKHDLEYIEKVCGLEAYGKFSGLIQSQKKHKKIHKYQEIFNVVQFKISHVNVVESKMPVILCEVRFYEIACMIDKTEPENIVEGSDRYHKFRDFDVAIIPHPKPDVENVGHEWIIIRATDKMEKLRLEDKNQQEQSRTEDTDTKKEE